MNVLVTGADRGIGRFLALAFGRAGHTVGVHCRTRRSQAEKVQDELARMGVRADVFQADVADPAEAQALVDDARARWGRLDGLVNNAGVTRDRSLLAMSPAEWREVLDVNLSGVFWCLQAAARHMRREKNGFVINIASILGARGGVGCANYAAAKAGVMALTKSAARELGRFDIRVNAVLPGFHLTEMSEQIPPEQRAKVVAEHALGRTTDPADLGRLVVALAESPTVSGQIFNIDSRGM